MHSDWNRLALIVIFWIQQLIDVAVAGLLSVLACDEISCPDCCRAVLEHQVDLQAGIALTDQVPLTLAAYRH